MTTEFLNDFQMEDDSDVKIASNTPATTQNLPIEDDTDQYSEQFLVHKENGNLDRTKNLGVQLVSVFSNSSKFSSFGIDDKEINDEQSNTQRHLLLIFTIIYVVENMIADPFLCEAARGCFWRKLEETNPSVYKIASQDAAFSLYYLCSRTSTTMAQSVGMTFAKLCGHSDDEIYERYGRSLFLYFTSEIKNIVENQQFVELDEKV